MHIFFDSDSVRYEFDTREGEVSITEYLIESESCSAGGYCGKKETSESKGDIIRSKWELMQINSIKKWSCLRGSIKQYVVSQNGEPSCSLAMKRYFKKKKVHIALA
jgi:hypothetical protein